MSVVNSYLSMFGALFTNLGQESNNETSTLSNMTQVADYFYDNPILACSLRINPIDKSANDVMNFENVYLRPIYNGDCKTVYPPEEFIGQYDKEFTSNCEDYTDDLREVKRQFQKDLNLACHDLLLKVPSNYPQILKRKNEEEILKISSTLITAYHEAKCLSLSYDFNSSCRNACNTYIINILRLLEPSLCQVKYNDLSPIKKKKHCGKRGNKMLNRYARHANGALLRNYRPDKYCREFKKGVQNDECSTYSHYNTEGCENNLIADFNRFMNSRMTLNLQE